MLPPLLLEKRQIPDAMVEGKIQAFLGRLEALKISSAISCKGMSLKILLSEEFLFQQAAVTIL